MNDARPFTAQGSKLSQSSKLKAQHQSAKQLPSKALCYTLHACLTFDRLKLFILLAAIVLVRQATDALDDLAKALLQLCRRRNQRIESGVNACWAPFARCKGHLLPLLPVTHLMEEGELLCVQLDHNANAAVGCAVLQGRVA